MSSKTFSSTSKLNMTARKKFFIVTNLIGLNFSQIVAPKKLIALYQFFTISFAIYLGPYRKLLTYRTMTKDIYFATDALQIELFLALELTFVARSIIKSQHLKAILEKSNFNIKSEKHEAKFFMNLAIIFVVRASKVCLMAHTSSLVFNVKTAFVELTFSTSDFIFEYLISQLTSNLRDIKINQLKMKNLDERSEFVRLQVLHNLMVKREIQNRFSFELFATTAYNFLQLIISLYYICMRVKFNHLHNVEGELSS